jgi:hypothetical protein
MFNIGKSDYKNRVVLDQNLFDPTKKEESIRSHNKFTAFFYRIFGSGVITLKDKNKKIHYLNKNSLINFYNNQDKKTNFTTKNLNKNTIIERVKDTIKNRLENNKQYKKVNNDNEFEKIKNSNEWKYNIEDKNEDLEFSVIPTFNGYKLNYKIKNELFHKNFKKLKDLKNFANFVNVHRKFITSSKVKKLPDNFYNSNESMKYEYKIKDKTFIINIKEDKQHFTLSYKNEEIKNKLYTLNEIKNLAEKIKNYKVDQLKQKNVENKLIEIGRVI